MIKRLVLGEAGIGVALVVLAGFFVIAAPNFATEQNLRNIMTQITLNTVLAVGMTFVILVGGIDLSVGSAMALCAVVSGTMMAGSHSAVTLLGAILVSVLVGGVVGWINGFVSEQWRVPSFIVTLAMLNVARGAAERYTDAATIYNLPAALNDFGTLTLLGVPAVFWVALLLAGIGWFVLSRTVFGRLIYATGNNEEAVRLSGHKTSRIKIAAFMIAGLTVGIAAVLYMARLNIASPILGQGYELNAIAAVVIGGASLMGGRGSMAGTFLGACLLGVLTNGLLLMGVSDFERQIITGLVILVAVVLDAYRLRLARKLAVTQPAKEPVPATVAS
ncbi:ABC transporter permease [Nonomuraea roseoviolacea]|uniref:Ribose transport system permease protein n=1 Tax=Nonomuraea roseoviolacea subsp. carminata TaxID=160689 RepID=A0ABT1JZU7_9ACTN|nr:ABC transporter permease [Nonomuraea roseoviolacea]MCP2347282.1 ribose transport system permease protein [Nonomuraea roseoviolacea subsp. carminata]